MRGQGLVNVLVRGLLRTPGLCRIIGNQRADVRNLTQEADVVSAYAHMARVNPAFARFNNVRAGADGEPDDHDLHLAWRGGARAIRLTPQR